jgi:hypothetical protein
VSLVKMRSTCIRVGPKSNNWCPYKKNSGHTQRRRFVMMESETGMKQRQAKDC